MKKVLITGASGYIGPYLCNEFLKLKKASHPDLNLNIIYNNHALLVDGITSFKCDLLNTGELTKIYEQVNPDTVIHLASGTPTRISGQDDSYIRQFNAGVTAHLAKLAAQNNALMIYTSTDLVYNEGTGLKENISKLNPLTIYAKTKLEGEEAIQQFAKKYLILRTALVFGFTLSSYTSFYDVAYLKLKNNEPVNAFTDQYRNPLYVCDASRIISSLPALYYGNDIINFCGEEYLSRYEMCLRMAEIFSFDNKLIIPASCDRFTDYITVKKLGLNPDKLIKMGIKTTSYKNSLIHSMNFKPM